MRAITGASARPAGQTPKGAAVEFDTVTATQIRAIEANWDARTPVHVASRFYGLDGTRDAAHWFAKYEWEDLGDLARRDVIHLQCHLGTETAAFARRGARAVGLDLSAASVATARRIAADAGVEIEYVHANVYDAVAAVSGRHFDVVYTGKGALCYLPDLTRWAEVVAELLRPGGRVYVMEFHPLFASLGPKPEPGEGPELLLRKDYVGGRGARRIDATHTYTDGPPLRTATTSYEWAHGIGEVVTALVDAGLRVQRLRETEQLPWPRWHRMVPTESGWWRLPDTDPRIPLLYALLAEKEGPHDAAPSPSVTSTGS